VVTLSAADPLGLDRETMRELGNRTVDMLVDWLGDAEAPPLRRARPSEMRARVAKPLPAEGEPFEEILLSLAEDVLPHGSRIFYALAKPDFVAAVTGHPAAAAEGERLAERRLRAKAAIVR
jgi:hypothetical protein